jgi:hypothetical protein
MEHFDVTQTHYLTQLPSKTRKMLEELEKHLGLDSEKVLEKSVGVKVMSQRDTCCIMVHY